MKFSNLVAKEFKNVMDTHYLIPIDKNEVKYYYTEGFEDGLFNMYRSMLQCGVDLKTVKEVVRKLDPKGETLVYEFLEEALEEENS